MDLPLNSGPWTSRLIAGHRRVHLRRPGIDASGHVHDPPESVFLQPGGYPVTAHAAVTEDRQRLLRIQLTVAVRHLVHRDGDGAGKRHYAEFPRLAHVEHLPVLARADACGQIGRPQLLHHGTTSFVTGRRRAAGQKRNSDGGVALRSGFSTVSNRLSRLHSFSPVRVIRRASMTGASPTTRNRRPSMASASAKRCSKRGTEPVTAMASNSPAGSSCMASMVRSSVLTMSDSRNRSPAVATKSE